MSSFLTPLAFKLLGKTVDFLSPKVGEMIERGIDDAETKKALETAQRLADGVVAEEALVPILRCEYHPTYGIWRKTAHFFLDLHNVSPVVLQVDDCFVTLTGWSEIPRMMSRRQFLRSEKERGKRKIEEVLPGKCKTVEFDCPIELLSAEPSEGRAILVDAQIEVELQGPANHLCGTVNKSAGCWMPWRELGGGS